MAMRSGFFESDIVGYDAEGLPILDRAEDAEFHAEYFKSFIGNGVFIKPEDNFKVTADTGTTLAVAPGRCFIQGFFAFDYERQVVTLGAADPILNRIDRIVLRLDLPERVITVAVKQGTLSETPEPPALTRPETGSADIYELGIADVLVSKNSVAVTQAQITDLRLSSEYCGIVSGVVDQIDLQEVFNQYETYLSTHIAAWDAREAKADADWQAQMAQQAADYSTKRTEIDAWYAETKTGIYDALYFDFDNLVYRKGYDYTAAKTVADGSTVWTEEIRLRADNSLYASRTSTKGADGRWTLRTVCEEQQIDTTIIYSKQEDGSWKGEVN